MSVTGISSPPAWHSETGAVETGSRAASHRSSVHSIFNMSKGALPYRSPSDTAANRHFAAAHADPPAAARATSSELSSDRGTDGRHSARASWRQAGAAVVTSLQIADSFKTLRDMGGANDIRPADLKVLKRLGAGAFAVVESALYSPEGTAPGEGRMVVVKRLKPEIVKHELDLANFINEVALLRKLSHKRVVEYIGAGCTDNSSEDTRRQSMFLVQELMDGGTLKQLVQRQMVDVHSCVYTMADAFRLGIHVAEGLAYLHNARPVVVHRDIKLENILLKGKDPHTAEAKIADFGLVALVRPKERGPASTLAGAGLARVQRSMTSKRLRAQRSNSLSVEEAWTMSVKAREVQGDKSALTPQNLSGRTGSFMYMAPEVYRQEPYTEKVDVFSFGVILFELLSRYQMLCAVSVTGTPEEVENYAAKVSEGYRPPIPEHWPESVRQLIGECWHQDPALRPPMARVRERLAAMVQDGTAADMELQTRPPACGCTIC